MYLKYYFMHERWKAINYNIIVMAIKLISIHTIGGKCLDQCQTKMNLMDIFEYNLYSI